MTISDQIGFNHAKIIDNVRCAAERTGRDPAQVKIIAVSKKQPLEKVQALLDLMRLKNEPVILGENYVQEFQKKRELLSGNFTAHLIGPLQSNKAAAAVALFDLIESVHTPQIALALNKAAVRAGKFQDIFLQINISDDGAKRGFAAEEAREFASKELPNLANLSLQGLMTITRIYDYAEAARPDFAALRRLRDAISKQIMGGRRLELSMGMSADYAVAVEEGATCVRVGTALFGAR